jgi:multicomponent K+:H+ antiporter subunit D
LANSAFFLPNELLERGREFGADMLAVTREAFGEPDELELEDADVGIPIPGTMAALGIAFLACALLLAGLPPLSGFVAKFALLTGLVQPGGGLQGAAVISGTSWTFVALLILSGLTALIAMTRAGISSLWTTDEREVPRVAVLEMLPVAGLLLLCMVLTVQAGPVMAYMEATAKSLHDPARYVSDVLATPQVLPDSAGTGQ